MTIELSDVSVGYDQTVIIDHIHLRLESGHFYCLLGANGIGKTTLFKSILGFLPVLSGNLLINEKPLNQFTPGELSEYLSYVPQAKDNTYDMTVLEVVVMGRARFVRKFSQPSTLDYAAAHRILNQLGIEKLTEKQYSEISGGEQQIVLIARALAQEAHFIIMDEPASNLDFENQKKVLECLKQLSGSGIGIVLSSHSPNHAIYCNMEMILIDKKKKIHTGDINTILTDQLLKDVYGVDICLIKGVTDDGTIVQSCCLVK